MRFIHLRAANRVNQNLSELRFNKRDAAPALHRHLNLTGQIKQAHEDGDEEAKWAGFHVTPGDTGRGAAL